MSFKSYTDCILRAFILHTKQAEIIKRKKEIIDDIADFYNFSPRSVLYIGFNPAILSDLTADITVTEVSQSTTNFLKSKNVKFKYEFKP